MPKIIIRVEHGAIQHIDGIPPDIFLEVRNYDLAGVDETKISTDEDGQKCQIQEWRASE
jgi:hypothetical protein